MTKLTFSGRCGQYDPSDSESSCVTELSNRRQIPLHVNSFILLTVSLWQICVRIEELMTYLHGMRFVNTCKRLLSTRSDTKYSALAEIPTLATFTVN